VKKTNVLLVIILVVCFAGSALAELKIGYVNSDRILSEYQPALDAQKELDTEAKKLEQEYEAMIMKLDSLNQAYERQKLIMSDSRRQEKENEIIQMQKQIQQFQVQKMGPQGEIYQKENELLSPIIQKINQAIQELGKEQKYDFIMNAGALLFAVPAHDLTEDVIYKLNRMSSE